MKYGKSSINVSRRDFIGQLGMLGTLAAGFPTAVLSARRCSETEALPEWTTQEPWLTLSAVQEHLFPAADGVPGASDIHAIVYLRNTLETPHADDEDRTFVFNGVDWLNELTQKKHKKSFTRLTGQQKETALRKIETSRAGRRWLSLLLTFLIEALLADPVYGGNPDGIGWKWLHHQPGFPRPPEDKTWYKLATRVSFQRKAGDA